MHIALKIVFTLLAIGFTLSFSRTAIDVLVDDEEYFDEVDIERASFD